jgi:hypothetical protein
VQDGGQFEVPAVWDLSESAPTDHDLVTLLCDADDGRR